MILLRAKFVRILKLLIVISLLAVILYVLNILRVVTRDRKCSEEESLQLLQNLCLEYKDEISAGNLCPAICDTKKIRYSQCTNYRRGKKVLLTTCDGVCDGSSNVIAVMKSKHPKEEMNFEPLKLETLPNGTITAHAYAIAKTVLENMLYSHIRGEKKREKDIFSFLWSMDFEKYQKDNPNIRYSALTALQNIWGLVHQDEYLFMKVHQHLEFIPKIYGTCGFFYVMEYAPPGDSLDPQFFQGSQTPWKERAQIALDLLEISQSFDYAFFEPLHFCDIKPDNFGIGKDKKVKILDSDSLFFNSDMMRNLKEPSCKSHEDCDFFDCRGWCDFTKGQCTEQRTNNNLQNICEDIFIDRANNFYSGLLHRPPAEFQEDLSILLEECAYPESTKGTIVRKPTPEQTHWKLHSLLKKTIQSSS